MAFTVARSAFNQWLTVSDARFLRRFWKAIDIAPERNQRPTGAPARNPRRRYSRDPALDGETVLLKYAGEIFGGFEFLISKLTEAEDGIIHDLRELASLLDAVDHSRLKIF